MRVKFLCLLEALTSKMLIGASNPNREAVRRLDALR